MQLKTKIKIMLIISMAALTFGCNRPEQKEGSVAVESEVASDPLPSWNDGHIKTAIIGFVERVTKRRLTRFHSCC